MTAPKRTCMACNGEMSPGERYCFHCGHDSGAPVDDLDPGSVEVDPPAQAPRAGRFVLLEQVGDGRMGTEWRAQEEENKRPATVRLLSPILSAEARVQKGLRALADLSHPNLARTIAIGVTPGGEAFWAIEADLGVPLRTRMAGSAPLPVRTAAGIACGILRAAEHAHAKGHLHLDLWPEKVFVGEDGSDELAVRVLDFGAVGALGMPWRLSGRAPLNASPMIYQSAEATLKKAVDARADLYSIGGILFEMLAGRPALQARDPMELMTQVTSGVAPPIRSLRADVPGAIDDLLRASLARDPARRPASASLMRERLEKAMGGK